MAYHDYISETEAANFAGVSASTLSRFAEAGYLKIEADTDGLKLYSKGELEELFGLSEKVTREIKIEVVEEVPAQSATLAGKIEKTTEDHSSYWSEISANPIPTLATEAPNQSEKQRAVSSLESSLPKKDPESHVHATHEEQSSYDSVQSGNAWKNNSGQADDTTKAAHTELIKLRSIVALQERLMEQQDQVIATLRRDCEWLRARIERFEEKGDRDQLLMLAETQMIRKLVTLQAQRKSSPLRAALEWVGLVSPRREDLPALQSRGTTEI